MASLEQQVASLRRELESLKLQLRGSPGVSTSGGAISIRTMQLGFPAELTSAYNSTTGYSWKRKRLEPPDFVNPGVQLTGDKAFEATSSTTVASGTSVWMEPSPDGTGYVFLVAGSGGSLTSDSVEAGNYTITANTPTSTGESITLPETGTYLLYYSVNCAAKATTISIAGERVYVRLYDQTFGAVVPRTSRDVVGVAFAGYYFYGSGGATVLYDATAGTVVRMEAGRSVGATWDTTILGGWGLGEMGYVKIA